MNLGSLPVPCMVVGNKLDLVPRYRGRYTQSWGEQVRVYRLLLTRTTTLPLAPLPHVHRIRMDTLCIGLLGPSFGIACSMLDSATVGVEHVLC